MSCFPAEYTGSVLRFFLGGTLSSGCAEEPTLLFMRGWVYSQCLSMKDIHTQVNVEAEEMFICALGCLATMFSSGGDSLLALDLSVLHFHLHSKWRRVRRTNAGYCFKQEIGHQAG